MIQFFSRAAVLLAGCVAVGLFSALVAHIPTQLSVLIGMVWGGWLMLRWIDA